MREFWEIVLDEVKDDFLLSAYVCGNTLMKR